MGLVGTTFAYTLFTTPDPWPGRENPVYVFPESLSLSDAHALQLVDLGLAPGLPFEITSLAAENERKKPKVYEISAVSSLITIREGSVCLWEETESEREQRLRRTGQSRERDTAPARVYLQFTYDALVETSLVIEFFVKIFKKPAKIKSEKAMFRSVSLPLPAGKGQVFSSRTHSLSFDVKMIPGIHVRPKRWKETVFDLSLSFSPVSTPANNNNITAATTVSSSSAALVVTTEKALPGVSSHTQKEKDSLAPDARERRERERERERNATNEERELYLSDGERQRGSENNTVSEQPNERDRDAEALTHTPSEQVQVVAVGQRRWLRSVQEMISVPASIALSTTSSISISSLVSPRILTSSATATATATASVAPSLFAATVLGKGKAVMEQEEVKIKEVHVLEEVYLFRVNAASFDAHPLAVRLSQEKERAKRRPLNVANDPKPLPTPVLNNTRATAPSDERSSDDNLHRNHTSAVEMNARIEYLPERNREKPRRRRGSEREKDRERGEYTRVRRYSDDWEQERDRERDKYDDEEIYEDRYDDEESDQDNSDSHTHTRPRPMRQAMRTRRKDRSPRVHLSLPHAHSHAQEEEDLSHSSGEKMNIRPGSPLSQSEALNSTFSSSLPANTRVSHSNAAADASMNVASFSALSLAGTTSPTRTEKERKRVVSVPVSSTADREKEQRVPIPLDLSLHRVAMKKGVYDALSIYGTDKKERVFPTNSNKTKASNKKRDKQSAKSGDESEFFEDEEEEEEDEADNDEEAKKNSTEKAEDDENAEENLCVVCLTNEKEIVLFPCRHCALCVECAQMLSDNGKKCPMCRQPVSLLIHLH